MPQRMDLVAHGLTVQSLAFQCSLQCPFLIFSSRDSSQKRSRSEDLAGIQETSTGSLGLGEPCQRSYFLVLKETKDGEWRLIADYKNQTGYLEVHIWVSTPCGSDCVSQSVLQDVSQLQVFALQELMLFHGSKLFPGAGKNSWSHLAAPRQVYVFRLPARSGWLLA